MRTKVTLVLIFLNVALFFFIFKYEQWGGTDARMLEARRRVLGSEAADIRTLQITNNVTGASFSLVRRGELWFLTKPVEWPANVQAATGIVHALQLLEHEATFKVSDLINGQSLADYGLDKPKLTVAFTSGEVTNPTVLGIGDATKVGNRLYILSPDRERVHVVNRSLIDTLSLSLDQVRSDTLVTIPFYEARSLAVQGTDAARVRIRRDGERWTFDTPIVARASRAAIAAAVGALNDLRTKTFNPPNPPATLPSASPTLRIVVEGNNRRTTLLLGQPVAPAAPAPAAPAAAPTPGKVPPPPATEYYAQIMDGETLRAALFTVTISDELLKTLRGAQEALREKRVLDFDPASVASVTIAAPNQPALALQRIDAAANTPDASAPWQFVQRTENAPGTQPLPADRGAVKRLLEQLSLLSAKKFQSDAPAAAELERWGFNRPEREITLSVQGMPTPLLLQLGTDAQRDVYARVGRDSGAPIYAVDADILRELPTEPRAWRERVLRELPAAARITALTLTTIGQSGAPVYTHTLNGNDTWNDAVATEPAPRQTAIKTIVTQLRTLRARSFFQDRFSPTVTVAGEDRPWRYQLDATVALPGGTGADQTSVMTLFFTDRVGGATQLAGSKEFDTVFAIEQPLLDALWTLTYGPRDPGPPPEPPAEPPPKTESVPPKTP